MTDALARRLGLPARPAPPGAPGLPRRPAPPPPPSGLAVQRDADGLTLRADVGLEAPLLWVGGGLLIGALVTTGFAAASLAPAVGSLAWAALAPAWLGIALAMRALRRRARAWCQVELDHAEVRVSCSDGSSGVIALSALAAMEVVTDKRGRVALRLASTSACLYFAGSALRRDALEWLSAEIGARLPEAA